HGDARRLCANGRGDAPVDEHAGIDAAREVLEGEDGLLGLFRERGEGLRRRVVDGGATDLRGERDELLLRAVVECAFGPTTLVVRRGEEALAGTPELFGLTLELDQSLTKLGLETSRVPGRGGVTRQE